MLFTFDVRDCESFLSKNRSVVKLYVQILWKMSKDRINENKGRVNARVRITCLSLLRLDFISILIRR